MKLRDSAALVGERLGNPDSRLRALLTGLNGDCADAGRWDGVNQLNTGAHQPRRAGETSDGGSELLGGCRATGRRYAEITAGGAELAAS